MEQQVTLDTNDLAAAVRAYTKLPNANVRFVANVAGTVLDVSAIVSGSTPVAEPPKQLATVVVEAPK